MILEIGLAILYCALLVLTVLMCIVGVVTVIEAWMDSYPVAVMGAFLFLIGLGLTLVLLSRILEVL